MALRALSEKRNTRLRQARRFRRMTVRVRVEIEALERTSLETATTLGAGGLFIEMENPLIENTPLTLRFQLPGSGRKFEIAGRVVWATPPTLARGAPAAGPSGGEPPCGESLGMGIEFTDRVAIAAIARELEGLGEETP